MSEPQVVIVGNVNVDMVMGPQEPWPAAGTEVVLPDYELRVGGSAGNAAFALEALGIPYRLLANAGDDMLGHWMQGSFGEAAAHWRLADVPTTVSVGIAHPSGERTFFTNRGHLDVLGPDDVLPFLPERAPDGAVALLVGIFLSPPLAASLSDTIAALKRSGYAIALDTGWPPGSWSDEERAAYSAWLGSVDLLLINEVETLAIGRAEALDDAVKAVRARLPEGATLVVKRGPGGASAWRGNEHASAPAPQIVVADSIGAGDVFNAAFLKAELAGAPLAEALRRAVDYASGVIATRPRRYRLP